jgi:hypothetical protein
MRRLDQNELKPPRRPRRCTRHPVHPHSRRAPREVQVSVRNPNTIVHF